MEEGAKLEHLEPPRIQVPALAPEENPSIQEPTQELNLNLEPPELPKSTVEKMMEANHSPQVPTQEPSPNLEPSELPQSIMENVRGIKRRRSKHHRRSHPNNVRTVVCNTVSMMQYDESTSSVPSNYDKYVTHASRVASKPGEKVKYVTHASTDVTSPYKVTCEANDNVVTQCIKCDEKCNTCVMKYGNTDEIIHSYTSNICPATNMTETQTQTCRGR